MKKLPASISILNMSNMSVGSAASPRSNTPLVRESNQLSWCEGSSLLCLHCAIL